MVRMAVASALVVMDHHVGRTVPMNATVPATTVSRSARQKLSGWSFGAVPIIPLSR